MSLNACLLPCVLFICTSLAAQTAQQAPSTFNGYSTVQIQVPGIYLTPVPNVPFSATEHVVSRQRTSDGTERVLQTTSHIARASSGMTYTERRSLLPESSRAVPRLVEGQIYDPTAMRGTLYDPLTHIARQVTYLRQRSLSPGPTAVSPKPPTGVVETDLGPRTVAGMNAKGIRRVRVIAAAASGTGKDVEVTDEFWFVPNLSIYVSIHHVDPRTGEQTIELNEIERTEPDPNRFRVPDEYKVVDETPLPVSTSPRQP